MSRKTNPRKANTTIAIIVDGKDEKWYIEKVKEHYPCDVLRKIKIEPNLPQKKKIRDLFDLAKFKVEEGYTHVILFIDFDGPQNNTEEFSTFNDFYDKYINIHSDNLPGRQNSRYAWMKKVILIINNPCLEYWYLLHFYNTSKFYSAFEPHLKNDIQKIPQLSEYEKSEAYYKNSPDIFVRLNKNDGLKKARTNATTFNMTNCRTCGCSEMNRLFDFFDNELNSQ